MKDFSELNKDNDLLSHQIEQTNGFRLQQTEKILQDMSSVNSLINNIMYPGSNMEQK
jgi:hypothetical protein